MMAALEISSAAWEIYIVQFDSYVHLSESRDTMIPLQTGLCGGTKKISIIPFLFCPRHKFISSTVSHSPKLEIGIWRGKEKNYFQQSAAVSRSIISAHSLSLVYQHTHCSALLLSLLVSLSFCISACFKQAHSCSRCSGHHLLIHRRSEAALCTRQSCLKYSVSSSDNRLTVVCIIF